MSSSAMLPSDGRRSVIRRPGGPTPPDRMGASRRFGSHVSSRRCGAIPIKFAVRIRAVWCWLGVDALSPELERRRIGDPFMLILPPFSIVSPGTSAMSVRGESVR